MKAPFPVTELRQLLADDRAKLAKASGIRNRAFLEGRIVLAEELLTLWGTPAKVDTESVPRLAMAEKKLAPYRGLLGVRPDVEVACLAGLSTPTVAKWRRVYGIPMMFRLHPLSACNPSPPPRAERLSPWQRQIKARLGVIPDAVLAREVGRSGSLVQQFRVKQGIPPAPREAGRQCGRQLTPLPEEVRAWFGKLPDRQIAQQAGVSPSVVVRWRQKHSLPPSVGSKPSRLDAFLPLFGTVSDSEIARRAGVTPGNVAAYRRRHPELPPTLGARKP